jgi:hypothetical protein
MSADTPVDERYFRLWDDMTVPGRWMLETPRHHGEPIDPWQFFDGRKLPEPGPLTLRLRLPGRPLDYTMADHGVPILSTAGAGVLTTIAPHDVQLFPVQVDGQSTLFYIPNAVKLADCVDEARSEEVQRWTEADGRQDRLGHYKSIGVLRLDPTRIRGLHFFRVQHFDIALVVSRTLKDAMERANLVGPEFNSV